MTPLVRAMTLFGHGGAWRKNFGLPGRWGSSSSFIVCRKDYSGSRVFPQVKKRAAGNDTLQETENRNSAINSPQTCGRRETQFAAGHARRLNEFYLTGTFRVYMPRKGTRYVIRPENEHLISAFIEWKKYGPNTRDDVRWVLRKYFYYFEEKGYTSLKDVPLDMVREFITDTAEAVKPASLHNIFLYLKYFHLFLKEKGIPAPDAQGLFSYKVYRDKRIQDYVTDEELEKILGVIDGNTEVGKRNRAIILLAATTGLRACDIIRMKLQDIDWRKGEIRLLQKKTGHMVYIPLLRETGDAIQDYILNFRPGGDCQEVFLRAFPPKVAITDPASIGSMFIAYQKKAGVYRKAFDGKGFHGLRRRLAKKLLVTGTPLTTISQILGHEDPMVARQYLSMDVSNLKECALDFRLIPVGREVLS